MRPLQVALYARVSSEQQTEAGTIESQLAALRDRLEQDGFRLCEELTFIDQGYSGATFVRPALEQLRDVVALEGIDRLYVLSPDRLARRYAYQVLLIDEFERSGCEVVFLNRELGQSPEDHLLLQVQGMIAEYERAKMIERSRRGKRHGARTGKVAVLGGAPYGYRYITRQDGGGEARYEIITEEAQVVRQIFHWVGIERCSIGEVSRRLRQAGSLTRTGKANWDRATLWGMLKNPAYKGEAAFGKTKAGALRPRLRAQRGRSLQPRRAASTYDVPPQEWTFIPVPALVEEALFETVQEQLQANRRRARQRRRGARYLLQGLLCCAECGYAYYGKAISKKAAKGKVRHYAYYRCTGTDAYRFGGERICVNKQVRTDKLDALVWQEVCDLLRDGRRVKAEYQRRLAGPGKGSADLEAKQAQMAKVRRGIARLIDSYTEGFIEKQEFEPRVRRLRQRLERLEGQAQQISDAVALQAELHLVITRLEEFAARVQDRLEEADWLLRRELIRLLVKRVEVGQEEVEVVFRIPLEPVELAAEKKSLPLCRRNDDAPLRRAAEGGVPDGITRSIRFVRWTRRLPR